MPQVPSTILLVDESRFFLSMEKQFLRNVPATVLEAQSASRALEICRATPPQLIFLADVLADENGLDCCRRLKADPALADIPVVLVCEKLSPTEKDPRATTGCSAVLTKPLDRHRFLETGRKFLAGIREARRPCLIGVTATLNGHAIVGKGLDLSSGGLFFDCGEALPLGAIVELTLHLARPQELGDRIQCSGEVAWHNNRANPTKAHHPPGYGLKFTRITPLATEILGGYLKKLDLQKQRT